MSAQMKMVKLFQILGSGFEWGKCVISYDNVSRVFDHHAIQIARILPCYLALCEYISIQLHNQKLAVTHAKTGFQVESLLLLCYRIYCATVRSRRSCLILLETIQL